MSAIKKLIEKGWNDEKINNGDLRAAEKDLARLESALAAARTALKIHQLLNSVRTDTDGFLFEVAVFGLGEGKECPNPSDYGLDGEELSALSAARAAVSEEAG